MISKTKKQKLIKDVTDAYQTYRTGDAKRLVEQFFWHSLCDNYLEIVKDRLYNPDNRGKDARLSAQYTLYHTMLAVLKMMAPIMPHITEEIYHFYFNKQEKALSIHISEWPKQDKKLIDEDIENIGDKAVDIIAKVRQEKTQKQKSMKAEVKLVIDLKELEPVLDDIKAVTNATEIEFGKNLEINL